MRHEELSLTNLIQDIGLLGLSVTAALLLARSDAVAALFVPASDIWIVGAFVAGVFFTSIFTTPPAIAVIVLIAQQEHAIVVAFIAAIGALMGDYLMFRIARDRFSGYVMALLSHTRPSRRLLAIFRMRLFRWATFFVGTLIIASPLPDELGIALLGFARIDTVAFAPLSFLANFAGLYVIAVLA